ncbi:MAG: AAA family ATPase [Myxococcales bacterium]|nr:AAA family ATPase [Myxococcales bacterium]
MARPIPPVDTAWRRFQAERGRGAGPFAALLRRLETQAPLYNLDRATPTLAAEIAVLAPEADRAALTLLVMTAFLDAAQGSTRTPLDPAWLTARFQALLGPDGPDPAPLVTQALAQLDGPAAPVLGHDPDGHTPLIMDDGALYLQRLLVAERRLAEGLAARLRQPVPVPDAVHLEDVTARPPHKGEVAIRLSAEQRQAVLAAASGTITLVSGGPGTGKTSVVVSILRTLVRAGVAPDEVALAAPTGKAAWRMLASVRAALDTVKEPGAADRRLRAELPPARTLHRLLGYSPQRDLWRHHAKNPLSAQVVIVDEASMIDVFLMDRLVRALAPTARLVLLGDADQLPSVAAGAVFRDALSAAGPAQVKLTHSYRMRKEDAGGATVLRVAQKMNAGEVGLFGPELAVHRPELATLTGQGVEHAELPRERRRGFLDRWYRDRARGDGHLRPLLVERVWTADVDGRLREPELAQVFGWFEQARVLCLTQAFELGARRVNARLHDRAAREAGAPPERPFLAGEPVMVLHNDYDRGLFNGDQGVVLRVEDGEGTRPMAVFPDPEPGVWRAFALGALAGRLSLAYAMTVHKAQGSEFDAVAVLLPDRDLPLLTRELLYTAVTRARRSVWLLGDRALLNQGVRRAAVRHAGLAARLRPPAPEDSQ